MAGISFFSAFTLAVIIAYFHHISIKTLKKCIIITIVPVTIMGKVMFYFSSKTFPSSIMSFFAGGGFVFYGGLIGLIIGIIISSKVYDQDFHRIMNCLAIPVLVAQALGRLGCYFNGCCYGKAYSGIGAVIHQDIYVYPTQFMESLICVIISIVLLFFPFDYRYILYCLFYGICRFIIELFRGDDVRGHFGLLSTSQWISIAFIAYGLRGIYLKNKREKSLVRNTKM